MNPNPAMAKQLAVRDVPSLVYDAVNLEGVGNDLARGTNALRRHNCRWS